MLRLIDLFRVRSELFESILIPELKKALTDLKTNPPGDGILIGGVALSYYCRPRTTEDLDFLFADESAIPVPPNKFKKARSHAWIHKSTQIEVELLTPEFLKIPTNIVDQVISTARTIDTIRIASPSGLVALKLCANRHKDRFDIVELIKHCESQIVLDNFDLTDEQLDLYQTLLIDAHEEMMREIRD